MKKDLYFVSYVKKEFLSINTSSYGSTVIEVESGLIGRTLVNYIKHELYLELKNSEFTIIGITKV